MTLIANPIYDAVFKFLMEDERVAKMLLSALLKKEIVELQMRQHEYTCVLKNRISLFRMDFSAKIKEYDGTQHIVLIELQKTWLATETLRFRQYLGSQYLSKETMRTDDSCYGLPIITIYILGHILGEIHEPVVYVRRRYLDHDDNEINQRDPFIESLTHDSIVVQIPYLKGRTRNRLERLLNVFDQDYQAKEDEHLLNIDENMFQGDEQLIVNRLIKAGLEPTVRREMDIEDEILSELEARDTAIMQRDQIIEQKEQVIEQKEQVIEQKEQVIEQKEQEIEQKEQEIEQKEQEIVQKEQELEKQKQKMKNMVVALAASGMTIEDISEKFFLSKEEISTYLI